MPQDETTHATRNATGPGWAAYCNLKIAISWPICTGESLERWFINAEGQQVTVADLGQRGSVDDLRSACDNPDRHEVATYSFAFWEYWHLPRHNAMEDAAAASAIPTPSH